MRLHKAVRKADTSELNQEQETLKSEMMSLKLNEKRHSKNVILQCASVIQQNLTLTHLWCVCVYILVQFPQTQKQKKEESTKI